MVKPRRGSGARSIHPAADRARDGVLRRLRQGAGDGPAADGRARVLDRPALRPRRPLPERDPAHDDRVARRRVDQGHGDRRPGADRRSAARVGEALRRARARARSRRSATPRSASASPTSTRASAARSRRRCTPRCPGRTYPELIVRMARGERIEPHVGEFRAGHTFTRWYWQLELDERAAARPAATSSRTARAPRADVGERRHGYACRRAAAHARRDAVGPARRRA